MRASGREHVRCVDRRDESMEIRELSRPADYPSRPVAFHVMMPQTKCSIAT